MNTIYIPTEDLKSLIEKAGDKRIIFHTSGINPNNGKPIIEVYFNLDLECVLNDCM
jgi:hypothetical protein